MKSLHFLKIISSTIAGALAFSTLGATYVNAAKVEATDGTRLQTILIENDSGVWTTQSWGGENILPNSNWTTLDISDYYENGILTFDVRNQNDKEVKFNLGLISRKHGENSRVYWTNMDKYNGAVTANSSWKSYSFSIKEVVDSVDGGNFDLHNFWYVAAGGVPKGNVLEFKNVKISSTDDERQRPFIKVNQVGYFCNGKKSAKVSYFSKFGSLTGKTYEVVNADTGAVVFSDTLKEGKSDTDFSGEVMHIMNFDEVTMAGNYYIRIPYANLNSSARSSYDIESGLKTDTLTSYTFKIASNVYDDMLSDLLKYYYYQRQGMTLEEKYAGKFARENLHPDDSAVVKWSDRNNPNAKTYDVSGGWYDAGDYGKYVCPAATSVEDLFLAYDINPTIFANMKINIPETDKSSDRYVDAPALLSEIKYEIDMLLKLEHESKDGSFYIAANYKDDKIYIEDTLYSSSDYTSGASQTDLRSHQATIEMSAMLAHAYLIYSDIPAYRDFAETCLNTSLRAWNWAIEESHTRNHSIGAANRTYTFSDEDFERSAYWAAGTLFRAFKKKGGNYAKYEQYLIDNCENENVLHCFNNGSLGYSQGARSFLGFYHYLNDNDSANENVKTVFTKFKEWRRRTLNYDNWGMDYPIWGYWWGSNQVIIKNTMTTYFGSILTEGKDNIPSDVYLSTESSFNYMLGVNPLSFSYLSGYGENCVKNIYSGIYSNMARLNPYDCPDGYFTEGVNNYDNRHLSKYNGKCYVDNDSEYTTNENTIYGNAAMILLTATIMSNSPDEEIDTDTETDTDTFSDTDTQTDTEIISDTDTSSDTQTDTNTDTQTDSDINTDEPIDIYKTKGDVNLDGNSDIIDIALMRSHIVGNTTLDSIDSFARYRADLNDDEDVDIIDVVILRKNIVG